MIEVHESTQERRILTSLITDATVLGRITTKWDGNLFDTKSSNIIAEWCVDYFKKYNQAPKEAIQLQFAEWAETHQDRETIKRIESFLSSLSDEFEQESETNPMHTIDMAGEFFNRIKLRRLAEGIQNALDNGKIAKAEAAITSFSRVEMGAGAGIHFYTDEEAIRSVFAEKKTESLIEYNGAMESFFGYSMERDGFIAFAGPQKSSKSFWLLDTMYRSLLNRKKVAYFQIGDLSERQIEERLSIRSAAHPRRSPTMQWPCTIRIPKSIEWVKEDDNATVTYNEKIFEKPLGANRAVQAAKKLMDFKVKSKRSYFCMKVWPNLSVNVHSILSILEQWELEDFRPDVVIIDYMDNFSPVDARMEQRDQINYNWKYMRKVASERHCLIVTATQVNAAGFGARWLTRKNFSEDNRKLNHVTGMIGINVNDTEKKDGVCRLNWIVRREEEFSSTTGPSVAGCLAIANPAICSVW